MNNVHRKKVKTKYILFSMIFVIIITFFFLYRTTENSNLLEIKNENGVFFKYRDDPRWYKHSLKNFIEYNNSSDYKEISINLNGKYNPKLKNMFIKLSESDKKLFKQYKKIKVNILNSNVNKETFRTIIEQIRPTELHMYLCGLFDDDIKGIKLNNNIKIFRLNHSCIRNMDKLFGNWNKKLIEVDISSNMLNSLPKGLRYLNNLKKLNINGNYLNSLKMLMCYV